MRPVRKRVIPTKPTALLDTSQLHVRALFHGVRKTHGKRLLGHHSILLCWPADFDVTLAYTPLRAPKGAFVVYSHPIP
jgi:hypothetical protein